MPRTDRASSSMLASPSAVFGALVDRRALESWLPPDGMSGRFEWFDPRPGGSYRLVLTYADPTGSPGKSSADADVVDVRFVEILPDERMVQSVEFAADRPEFAGTMTMTWTVRADSGGTLVAIVADNVPDGISAEDHAAGLASSLENLARIVESTSTR
ncbi:MAG: SRPBCC family protein [Acidimicrobiia bacterium]